MTALGPDHPAGPHVRFRQLRTCRCASPWQLCATPRPEQLQQTDIASALQERIKLLQQPTPVAVAEEGHITRAAERLGIQQPPLSRLIKTIEQEVGVLLFRRVPRGVELTEAGRVFLDGARATFSNLDLTLESARRTDRGEQGQISLGFTSSAGFHPLVPGAIREFREAFPLVA